MKTDLKIGIAVGVVVIVAGMIWIVEKNNKTAVPENPPIPAPVVTSPAPTPAPTPATTPVTPAANVIVPPAGTMTPGSATTPSAPITPPPAVAAPVIKPPAPEEPARPAIRYHTVQKGESLSSIAQQYYGNGKFWKVIQQANQQIVPNPEKLRAGMKLRIPYPEEIANQKAQ